MMFSCNSEITEEEVMNSILQSNEKFIISNFYEPHKLEKNDLSHIMKAYGDAIKANDKLIKIDYFENFRRKKRPRHGAIFIDQNNNFIYSITYKFVTLKNGLRKINFIDFRSSSNDLPCLKFPSKFPIKCAVLPIPIPEDLSTLEKEYPKIIGRDTIHHEQLLPPNHFFVNDGEIQPVLVFNLGNKLIERNIESILEEINLSSEFDEYLLSSFKGIGEPTINISVPKEHIDEEIIHKVDNILKRSIGAKTNVIRINSPRKYQPRIVIGNINSQAKVRVCGPLRTQ